jgi:hypothetical protein
MKRTKNKWYPNDNPGWIERLLVRIFKVRLIPQGNNLYIRRIYLSPLWKWLPKRIFLHHLMMSDSDSALHDHAWDFKTRILTHEYHEYIQTNSFENYTGMRFPHIVERTLKAGDSAFNKAEHIHRVVLKQPVWTLVIASKPRRVWGFHDVYRGFVPWRKFLHMEDTVKFKDYDEDLL